MWTQKRRTPGHGPSQHGVASSRRRQTSHARTLWGGAGVGLPGVDLERGRLQVHEVEIGLAELGRDETMGQHAAGLGDPVDLIADVGHLLRRHHRFLGIRSGRGRDEPDRRLTIEEDLLHKILPREVGHGAAVGRELRVHPLGPLAQLHQSLLRAAPLRPASALSGSYPVPT